MASMQNEFASYKWKIKNFSKLSFPGTNPYIYSPEFHFIKHKFYLRFYPQDSLENLNNYALVSLMREKPFVGDIKVLCRFSLLDSQNKKCLTNGFEAKFEAKYSSLSINGGIYLISRDYILDEANGLLLNDTLSIYCEIELLSCESTKYRSPELNSLLESAQFSDVLFVVGNEQKKEFRLHKAILASRCPVFAAMFTNDCEEKRKNRVEITDMTVAVFEEMIRYIYTGQTGQGLGLYAEELFAAADKYQLDQLKGQVTVELASKLSTESVSGILLLADRYNHEQLKSHCIEYINRNAQKVIQTEAWSELIETRADLMAMLYRDTVNSK